MVYLSKVAIIITENRGRIQLFNYQNIDFNVHHSISENYEDPFTELHMHNVYELYCFLDGEGVFNIEGNTYPLERGTIMFLRPGEAHSVHICPSKKYERIALHFSGTAFVGIPTIQTLISSLSSKETGHCFLCNTETEYHLKLFREIVNPESINNNTVLLSIMSNLPALLYSLNLNNSQGISVHRSASDRLVRNIIHFIDENLTGDWTLDDLAAHMYRDKAYLNRRFKTVVGTSIWDYTIRKRIIAVQQNIHQYSSISDAFHASGFKDYSTFFRNYTKICGVNPSDDIKKHRK